MTGRGRGKLLAAAGMTVLLAWLVLYPILLVAIDAAHGDAIAAFARRPGEWRALWASVWISLASVGLAAAIGIPLAFLFEWLEFPGRKTLGSLIALPAVLPPFVGVIAFLFLYGESGFVARAVQRLLGLAAPPWRLQGAGAICWCTPTRCTSTSISSHGRAWRSWTRRCSRPRRPWARHRGRRCGA